MESLNALLQGMGLMHLGAGQAIMLLVSLLLLWLAIAKKFEPLLLLPIGFGGLLSNCCGWRLRKSSNRYCCCRLASAACSPTSRKRAWR